jgi:GGDEF domain-containing protein
MPKNGYQLAYISSPPSNSGASDGESLLLCDPLTMLIAYPSFEEQLTRLLPRFGPVGLRLAIGDVDGLREYVSERRAADPACFGHLAGNDCMRRVGLVTVEWADQELGADWAFRLCGTFGGDEVIVAVAGCSHARFASAVTDLCDRIRAGAPRPCSFAIGTMALASLTEEQAPDAYRRLVSHVDASLFEAKEKWRAEHGRLDGHVWDVGLVDASREQES